MEIGGGSEQKKRKRRNVTEAKDGTVELGSAGTSVAAVIPLQQRVLLSDLCLLESPVRKVGLGCLQSMSSSTLMSSD